MSRRRDNLAGAIELRPLEGARLVFRGLVAEAYDLLEVRLLHLGILGRAGTVRQVETVISVGDLPGFRGSPGDPHGIRFTHVLYDLCILVSGLQTLRRVHALALADRPPVRRRLFELAFIPGRRLAIPVLRAGHVGVEVVVHALGGHGHFVLLLIA